MVVGTPMYLNLWSEIYQIMVRVTVNIAERVLLSMTKDGLGKYLR